jgi:hypothetical protein
MMQIDAELERERRLTRAPVSAGHFQVIAMNTKLMNDDMLRTSDDRLSARANVTHLSTNTFWQTMKPESGFHLLQLARMAMPKFDEMMYLKKKYLASKKRFVEWEEVGKGYALHWIALYNSRAKQTATMIHEYLYGVGKNATKKSERLVSKGDLLLDYIVDPGITKGVSYNGIVVDGFYNVNVEEAWQQKDTTPPATITALKTFCEFESHYNITQTTGTDQADDESDSELESESEDENDSEDELD